MAEQTNEKKQKHPYDEMPEAVRRMTPITDYRQIRDILGSRDFALAGRRQTVPFMVNTLPVIEGDAHAQRRRLEAALFRPAMLVGEHQRTVQNAIRTILERQVQRAQRSNGTVTVELVDLVMRVETLVMADFVGLDMPEDRAAAIDDLSERMKYVNDSVSLIWSRNDPIDYPWDLRHHSVDFIDRYIMPAVKRSRSRSDDEPAQTLIDVLVDAFDPATWDGELIAREASAYMAAGVQTSTYTILDALPHLIDWLRDHPEDRAAALDRGSDFLIRVISESLRIHVPNPAIFRIALRSGKTPSGIEYEEGDEFVLYTGEAHKDRSIFGDDAEEFNPYREPKEGASLWGFAFGHGHHACIGRTLALGRTTHEGDIQGYEGSTVSILRELVRLNVDYDPEHKPVYRQDTFKVAFSEFPARIARPVETS